MYAISNEYKEALKSKTRKTMISGTITTRAKSEINFNDSNLQKGSLYITNQCANKDELEFGSVFTAECGFTIKCDIDRYSLYGAKIELTETRELLDGTTEDVPCGIYYINEAKRNGSKISITAYDDMINLDVAITDDTSGNVWNLLNLIETKTGVELAQTQNEIETLPNYNVEFSVKKERLETYRDLLECLGKVTCTFGLITRDGKLKLQSYAKTKTIEVSNLERKTPDICDYETYYNSVKASFIAEENYYPYEVISDNPIVENGLQLDLGEIPIIQGLPETKYAILNDILDELIQIKYVPCNAQIVPNVALDLGDMVQLTKVNNDDEIDVNTLITYINWTYHGMMTIKSAGGNPKLNTAKSKTDKQITGALNNIPKNEVIVYSYENSKQYNIKYSEVEIIKFQFSTTDEANPILLASIQFNIDKDAEVQFRFFEDDVLRNDLTISKYYSKGNNFATLFMNAKDESGTRNQITIKASCKYYESDNRKILAKLDNINLLLKPTRDKKTYTATENQTDFELPKTYSENSLVNVYVNNTRKEFTISDDLVILSGISADDNVELEIINIDKTDYVPTTNEDIALMTIDPFKIHSVVYSQGLSANQSEWDGTVAASEEIEQLLLCDETKIDNFSARLGGVTIA